MMQRAIAHFAALGAAALLAACATRPVEGPALQAAFVVLGEGGQAVARAITLDERCPAIAIDGRAVAMSVRVPRGAIVHRRPKGQPSSPVLTCEAALPPGTARASIAGQALALPRADLRRIVVIGDTGCRLKGTAFQDCNDPSAFPFASVASAAAAFRPDLVVHVGDYHYREDPCPKDRPGCAGSPWGYGWETWQADFFGPGRALLAAAPWVVTRGNHESCARAGQGYLRYLDPRPFRPGRDCDDPDDDATGDHTDPYPVPLGDGAQLIVFDSSNTSWKGLPQGDPRRAIYADNWRKMEALAKAGRYNIAVTHHPLFAFGATRNPRTGQVSVFGGDAGLLDAFGPLAPRFLPDSISMLLSGHVHLWQQVSFASGHPTQFVSGFSGTAEDTTPIPDPLPADAVPAPGAVVEQLSTWIDGFGFMTMERTGEQSWRVKVWDRNGNERNNCLVQGRRSRCALTRVP